MRQEKLLHQVLMVVALLLLAVGCETLVNWFAGSHRNVAQAAIMTSAPGAGYKAELTIKPGQVKAGQPARLSFLIRNAKGAHVRFLQFVHEKPLHLLIVSEDLSEFYHIHPEMQVDDSYSIEHTFPYGGLYRLYADYTPPGYGTIVEQFEVRVGGPERTRRSLVADTNLTKTSEGLRITLSPDRELRAREDLMLKFSVSDEKTNEPVNNLQLYLGSLAHFVIISENLNDFIHVHPLEAGEVFDPSQDPSMHLHDPSQMAKQLVGPSPSEVSAPVSFPRAGLYKLWAQFQREGRVINVPFVLRVGEALPKTAQAASNAPPIPSDAIRINVNSAGYEPAQISVKRGQTVKLAFYRAEAGNCASTVKFPQLNISRELPVGEVVLIEVTPKETGELSFTCGMGMYKGLLVVN